MTTTHHHPRGPLDITWNSWIKLGVAAATIVLGVVYTIGLITGWKSSAGTGFLIGLVYATAAVLLQTAREDARYDRARARHDDAQDRDALVAAVYLAGRGYDGSVSPMQWFADWLRSDDGIAALAADPTIAGKLAGGRK